ncbi:Outer membrane protein IcsA autotransporter precursor [compost metagenome]
MNRSCFCLCNVALATALGMALASAPSAPASADTLFWDTNGNTAGLGGTGNWNTTDNVWNNSSTGTGGALSAWNNASLDSATFDGPGAATVTVGTPVTVSGLSIGATSTYAFNGAAVITLGGSSPTIEVLGGNSTIAVVLAGNNGLTKTGSGTLVLSGQNTYTGTTTISGGTLQVGNNTFSGAIVGNVVNNATLAFARTNLLTFNGLVSGSGNLRKRSVGTLILTGDNSYTGGTSLEEGTLRVNHDHALGTGPLAMSTGTTLDFGASHSLTNAITLAGSTTINVNSGLASTLHGAISDGTSTGALNKTGDGTLILTGSNTYTGDTTISTGVLQLGNGGATGSLLSNVINSGALVFNRSEVHEYARIISGSGSVSQVGTGTTVLNQANTYSGGTTIAGGTLQIGNNNFTGSIAGNVVNNGTLAFARTNFITFNGLISGSGNLRKRSGGTLILTGDNSYAGGTTLEDGTLRVNHDRALGSGPLAMATGTTLDFGASHALANAITLTGSAIVNVNSELTSTLQGPISDGTSAGTLNKTGDGTLVLTDSNTYTAGTRITAGTLQLGNGGTTGSILGNVANDGALVFNRNDGQTFGGIISGSGRVSKLGNDTLTLTGANTYSGATTVAQGTLRAGAVDTFSASSAHTIAPGATLDTAGLNQHVAALTNSGTLSLLGTTAGSSLGSSGAYVGNAGVLRLGTALTGSTRVSDRLILDGAAASASGNTTIQIANKDGLGALTTGNGIEVVSALNGATTTAQTTRTAFSLADGHVDAGAFEYRLYAADAQGAGESWYLRSTAPVQPTPQVTPGPDIEPPPPAGQPVQPGQPEQPVQPVQPGQPDQPSPPSPPVPPDQPQPPTTPLPIVQVPTYRSEVPLLASLPAQLRQADLAMLSNLHQRMGDEANGSAVTHLLAQPAAQALDDSSHRAWARVVYSDLDIEQPGTTQAQTDGHISGLQLGTDLWASGAWHAGVYVGYLDSSADIKGNAHGLITAVGSNHLRSQYLAAYATWMNAHGWYLDSVLQGSQQRYDARPDGNPNVSGEASSVTASLEAGKAWALDERWSIEPQVQIAYQHSRFDDEDFDGARVEQDPGNGWITRLGVRVKGDLDARSGPLQPYARLNLYHAQFDDDTASFIGPAGSTDIASVASYSTAEAATGATLALTPLTSLYGEIGHLWDIGGDASVSAAVQASVGIRMRW